MKVLITGGGGFVGRQVLDILAKRPDIQDIIVAGRTPPLPRDPRFRSEVVDLLEPGAPEALVARTKPSHLLHLAWNVAPGAFWRAPDNLDWMASSLKLARAFAEHGGVRFVGAGSVAEYAWDRPRLDRDQTPLLGATLYGVAKDALRRALEAGLRESGTSFAWGRIFWLYGPHEQPRRLVSDVAAALAAGMPIDCTDGRQIRDFMHVRDVAGAFVAALDSSWTGAFDIASGNGVAISEVVRLLADAAGAHDLVRLGARPSAPTDPPEIVGDDYLLRNAIGYHPTIPLRDGLFETLAWWKARFQDPSASPL